MDATGVVADDPVEATLDPTAPELAAALEAANAQIAELHAARDAAVAFHEAASAAHDAALATAVASYREALLAARPSVPAELVEGSDVAGVKASFERASAIVDRITESVRAQLAAVPNGAASVPVIPVGAGARVEPDFSALTPIEKIAAGLAASRNGR